MTDTEEPELTLQQDGWRKVKSAGAFMDSVGPLWAKKGQDNWLYGLLLTPRHLNPAGVVHGGLLETLMDHALSCIAWEETERSPCVTLQLDSHFLSAAHAGEFIAAAGAVTHRTKSVIFLRGSLRVGEREVLSAQALMKVQRT